MQSGRYNGGVRRGRIRSQKRSIYRGGKNHPQSAILIEWTINSMKKKMRIDWMEKQLKKSEEMVEQDELLLMMMATISKKQKKKKKKKEKEKNKEKEKK